jgi:AcrR family transcriptional regulator
MVANNMSALPLRERRIRRTKAEIQRCALKLFVAQGFDETTVAQVAAMADVSAMTVFRHFPTKEDLVISDDFDDSLPARIREARSERDLMRRIAGVLVCSLAATGEEERKHLYVRIDLAMRTPALRTHRYENIHRTQNVIAESIAGAGHAARFRAAVAAGACLSAVSTAMFQWAADGGTGDMVAMVRRAFVSIGINLDRSKR